MDLQLIAIILTLIPASFICMSNTPKGDPRLVTHSIFALPVENSFYF